MIEEITCFPSISKILGKRGVEYIFGLCGHTDIAVLAAFERKVKMLRKN